MESRREPRQQRSRETVEVILDAVTRLFVSRPLADIDVNEIARTAGVGVGSLYRYFPSKEAVLLAWEEREPIRLAQVFAEFHQQDGKAKDIVEGVRARAEFGYDQFLPLALRYAESSTHTNADFHKRAAQLVFVSELIASTLRKTEGCRLADIETGSLVAVTAFVHGLYVGCLMRPDAARDGRLRRELCDLVVRYITSAA